MPIASGGSGARHGWPAHVPDVAQTRLASWRRRSSTRLVARRLGHRLQLVIGPPYSRAALRLNESAVERSCVTAARGLWQKSLHVSVRQRPYKPSLGHAGRRRPDAAAAAREAQLAPPRCHRASRARLAGGALAGGSLWPPPARDGTAGCSAARWREPRRAGGWCAWQHQREREKAKETIDAQNRTNSHAGLYTSRVTRRPR